MQDNEARITDSIMVPFSCFCQIYLDLLGLKIRSQHAGDKF